MSEIETLKAWCHWKRKGVDVTSDELEMVKAIEDLISRVGTLKAERLPRPSAERFLLQQNLELREQRAALTARIESLEGALRFIAEESCCDSGTMLCCDAFEVRARQALAPKAPADAP